MGPDTGIEIPSIGIYEELLSTMSKGRFEVKSPTGSLINIQKKLGGGGTKTVYEASDNNGRFALAVPNIVDNANTAQSKWTVALQEPTNTKKVQEAGLLTNTRCETLPCVINGVPFPALAMTLYEDLPFKIYDKKNPQSSSSTPLMSMEKINFDQFKEIMSTVLPDLAVLINNGILVHKDSINLCTSNGKLRPFLNDLGDTRFKIDIPEEDKKSYSTNLVYWNVNAFLNGITEQQFQQNRDLFNGQGFSFKNPNNAYTQLIEQLNQLIT